MKYFITGCTGFIGTHLCRYLINHGHIVYGLVRNKGKIASDIIDKLNVVEGDLSIFENKHLVLPKVDIIIHLAGVVTAKNDDEYEKINYTAVENFINLVKRQNWAPKRFIFSSSLAVMGPNIRNEKFNELDMPAPIDSYGLAKLHAEEYLFKQKIPTTSFRPSLVFGPGDPATLTLFKMAKSACSVLPYGKPQRLSYIYIDDLVYAIYLMSLDHSEENKIFFISSEDVITNHEIMKEIASAMGKKIKILFLPKFLIKMAMYLSVAYSIIMRRPNKLDKKQFAQMTAPAFVCTAKHFSTEFSWSASTKFKDAICKSAQGYKNLNLL